jgi:ketosteroid isomerase-like protein
MRQENVETVRRAIDAFNRHDLVSWMAEFDPDVVWHAFPDEPEPGPFRGHQAVLAMAARWMDLFPDFRAEARGRSSGVELEMPATWVVEFREGKIARWQTFTDRSEAFAAVGLSEQDARAQDSS